MDQGAPKGLDQRALPTVTEVDQAVPGQEGRQVLQVVTEAGVDLEVGQGVDQEAQQKVMPLEVLEGDSEVFMIPLLFYVINRV